MKIAVSACLLGENCRYDGQSVPCQAVIDLGKEHELVPICPELLGGLSVPRPQCEVLHIPGSADFAYNVLTDSGSDYSLCFAQGAKKALAIAQEAGCEAGVFKTLSPSCGIGQIYDGFHHNKLTEADGITIRKFKAANIPVYTEKHVEEGRFPEK